MSLASLRAVPLITALLVALATLVAGLIPDRGQAQQTLRIAAVVNDDVISAYDLFNRLNMVVVNSKLPNNPQVRQRIAPQVLRRLIDEKLKLQEAERLEIEIKDDEIERALSKLEENNELPPGGLDDYLGSLNIDKSGLVEQLRATLAWNKVIARTFGPQVAISDGEITETLNRLKSSQGKTQYRVLEIFLPIDNPDGAGEVERIAKRLVEQVKNGADFGSLARSFSQSPSAVKNGDLGWIAPDRLGQDLAPVLERMKAGQMAGPIRTASGLHLIQLVNTRTGTGLGRTDIVLGLKQVFFSLPQGALEGDVQKALRDAGAARAEAPNCAAMDGLIRASKSSLSGDLGTVKAKDLPPDVAAAVQGLAVGTPSNPIRRPDGIAVLMVCSRTGGEIDTETQRERIRTALLERRLAAAAQRHIRELRRSAFIDIRL